MGISAGIVSPRFLAAPGLWMPYSWWPARGQLPVRRLSGLKFSAFPATHPPHTLFCSCADQMAPGLRRRENSVTISGGHAMTDISCEDFFLHPSQVLHRQYEAVRAVVMEHRPLPQVAQQFGYGYGSLRNLVTDFRARCRVGQAPPFSPKRPAVGHPALPRTSRSASRRRRPPPTAGNSPSPPGGACAPAWPESSCSCRCWPGCTSPRW